MTPSQSEQNADETPLRPKPLTDPADLMTLLGRFMACGVLFILTIAAFIMRQFVVGVCLAIFSIFWQRATTGLWRRLRDERIAAETARDAETVNAAASDMEGVTAAAAGVTVP